MSYLPNLV